MRRCQQKLATPHTRYRYTSLKLKNQLLWNYFKHIMIIYMYQQN